MLHEHSHDYLAYRHTSQRGCFLVSHSLTVPPPGAGGCVRGVPVLRAWAGLVLLQPSEDHPPLWPAVPPAHCGRRLLGPHARLSSRVSAGTDDLTQEVRRRTWTPEDSNCSVQPGSLRSEAPHRGAENGVRPQETLFGPLRLLGLSKCSKHFKTVLSLPLHSCFCASLSIWLAPKQLS